MCLANKGIPRMNKSAKNYKILILLTTTPHIQPSDRMNTKRMISFVYCNEIVILLREQSNYQID